MQNHDRILIDLQGKKPGKTLLTIAAMHGNEPASIEATARVEAKLAEIIDEVAGGFCVLLGNNSAYQKKQRYLDADLNRLWTPERVDALRANVTLESGFAEDTEQKELLTLIDQQLATNDCIILDLHSTSADSVPFVVVCDEKQSLDFYKDIPVAHVLLKEQVISGSLIYYFGTRGVISSVTEGGRHDAPSTVDFLEDVIWANLLRAKIITEESYPAVVTHLENIERSRRNLPHCFKVADCYVPAQAEQFQLKPGFVGFQEIAAGELVGRNINGDVYARASGYIFMPSYQPSDYAYFTISSR